MDRRLGTARIGEPLYQCEPPTGYSDKAETWVNTGALLNRLNFALAFAGNRLPGLKVDTAALIGALDLVISVDTSVAHAAAAVGTPLWLLAPHNVCWMWDMAGVESPWYPGVHLFRATRPRAWEPVIDAVAAALGTATAGAAR